jgi:hypothetical protein
MTNNSASLKAGAGIFVSSCGIAQRKANQKRAEATVTLRRFARMLSEIEAERTPMRLTTRKPIATPMGHPKRESETLVSGLRTGFMRLRAAMKLSGMARRVPSVVASNARKTVSMIFSQVTFAVSVKRGAPTLCRIVARMYCMSSLSRLGSLT